MAATISTFTDWKAVNSRGFIAPAILPARIFQFKLASYIYVYISDDGAGQASAALAASGGVVLPVGAVNGKDLVQDFVFQIVRGADAEGEDGELVFEAYVKCTLTMTAQTYDIGSGTALGFYIWKMYESPTKSYAEVRIPEPAPTTLGTAQLNPDPSAGSGMTNALIEVSYDIVTPAWNFDLQPGDLVRVPFAAAGQPYVAKNTAIGIRTILGGSVLHTLRDTRIGQSWELYTDAKGAHVVTTINNGGGEATGVSNVLVSTQKVSFGRLLRYGATIQAFLSGTRSYLLAPYSDAIADTQWKTIMDISTSINILACASSPDGAVLYAYGIATAAVAETDMVKGAPAYMLLKRGGDDGHTIAKRGLAALVVVEPPAAVPGALPAEEQEEPPALPLRDVAGMEHAGGVLRLTSKDGGVFRVWESNDEGATWEAL